MEFAVLAPILTLIALGAYDFGQAVQTSMRLDRAARAGAQHAVALPGDFTGMQAAVRAAWPELSATDVPVPVETCRCAGSVLACTSPCAGGMERTVTVTAQRSITTLVVPGLGARTARATVRTQ